MILLWGIPGDGPIAAVRRALQLCGAPYLFIDQFAVLETDLTLLVENGIEGTLRGPAGAIDLALVCAAYIRPYESKRVLRAIGHLDDQACPRRELRRRAAVVVRTDRSVGSQPALADDLEHLQALAIRADRCRWMRPDVLTFPNSESTG